MAQWHNPRTWSVGEVVSDTLLNEQIRDNEQWLKQAIDQGLIPHGNAFPSDPGAPALFYRDDLEGLYLRTGVNIWSAFLPSGMITMYSGPWNFDSTGLGTGKLAGWALCNGQNGTPDLRDRFVLGAGASSDLGQTGGSETQQATIPAHHHNVNIPAFTSGSGGGSRDVKKEDDPNWITTAAVPGHTHTIDPPATDTSDVTLTSNAFSILPPYLKLAYIMKL